ncbi:unnamed protein product, partial [Polarella glacialis]
VDDCTGGSLLVLQSTLDEQAEEELFSLRSANHWLQLIESPTFGFALPAASRTRSALPVPDLESCTLYEALHAVGAEPCLSAARSLQLLAQQRLFAWSCSWE